MLIALVWVSASACSDSPAPRPKSSITMKKPPLGAAAGDAGDDASSAASQSASFDAAVGGDSGRGRTLVDAGTVDGAASTARNDAETSKQADSGDAAAPRDRGPYLTSGAWHGYLWIAQHGAGTTVAATNFAVATFDAPVCISGTVPASSDSSDNAMLGVNLNQTQNADLAIQTVVPTRDGVEVDVLNRVGSPLRVQVQGLDGATNAQARWCAAVRGDGGFIPWSRFNTACWDDSGAAYQREPISAAMLLVPGTTDASTPFDFCLSGLAEVETPSPDAGM